MEITNSSLESQTPNLDARLPIVLVPIIIYIFATQLGHNDEEEGSSNGPVQGVARRGNAKDDHAKLHGGAQGFQIQKAHTELLITFARFLGGCC